MSYFEEYAPSASQQIIYVCFYGIGTIFHSQYSKHLPLQNNLHSNLPDEALLTRYRDTGDNLWLGILLQRYTVLLIGVAYKYLKNKELAEDAVQQVFLKALTHLPDEEIHNFRGWLYILMRNHCLQYLRDRRHTAEINREPPIPDNYDAEEAKLKETTLEQMGDALNQLVPEQRLCVELFYLSKLSYQQISERTGYSYMQVKSYIQNGKRNLKQLLLKKTGNNQ